MTRKKDCFSFSQIVHPNKRLLYRCKIFGIGSSWGGYSSLLSTMTVSENRNLKSSYVPTGNYLRIYTGSEDTEDLIEDLNVGFEKI